MTRMNSPGRTQSGAALVVGLLLLLVLTLLAISGMNTASLELVMAGNTQYNLNAFQAAESGIETALDNGEFVPGAVPERLPATGQEEIPGSGGTSAFVSTITSQLNGAPQPAMWGSSWDAFSTFHFEIASVGTSVRNATATNNQGVAIIAPQDPTVLPSDPTNTELTP